VQTVGITAGASAPERLVEALIDTLAQRFQITIDEVDPVRETVTFKLPRILSENFDPA
jgi:4-hydroxy-3-methylbut-2-enyl diphosphate reductase